MNVAQEVQKELRDSMNITVIDVYGGASGSSFGIHCLEDVTGDGVVDNFGSAMQSGKFSVPSIVFDPATIKSLPDAVEVTGTGVYSGYVDSGGAVRGVPCIAVASIGADRTKFVFKRITGQVLHSMPTGYPTHGNINNLPVKDYLTQNNEENPTG